MNPDQPMNESVCLPLTAIGDQAVGGKAKGLSQLMAMGLNVPPGFVVLGASRQNLPDDLSDFYEPLGEGKVAVRSSAIGEDSAEASFAGQYDTLLNVQGLPALEEAIGKCLDSLKTDRAESYRTEQHAGSGAMSVVVQKMVDARVAGVLFTTDPVSGRRDTVVVDAVPGLGESLVSGQQNPDHYVLSPDGRTLRSEPIGDEPILSDTELQQLVKEAMEARENKGVPLDMEFAFDQNGELFWLQARPITTLGADPADLDLIPGQPDDVYTTCNVGEILPGAVTPLTFSTVIRPMDVGMQRQHVAFGIQEKVLPYNTVVGNRFGHLMVNLTKTCEIGTNVAGASPEKICLAFCGRVVDEVNSTTTVPRWKQMINGMRFFKYVLDGKKALAAWEKHADAQHFPTAVAPEKLYEAIVAMMPGFEDAMHYHMVVTSGAGLYEPIIMEIISKGKGVTEEHHARLAGWLAGIKDIESADLAAGLERIMDSLDGESKDISEKFLSLRPEDALEFLTSGKAGRASREYTDYMKRHGHRALRELELRQKEWASDSLSVISSLQAALNARHKAGHRPVANPEADSLKDVNPVLRFFINKTRESVRRRERSKSLLIRYTVGFKRAFRELAERLTADGRLPDTDAIYFLTLEELGRLIHGESDLVTTAIERRKILDYQMSLEIPDVFQGTPEPLHTNHSAPEDGILEGTPVNCGKITGTARVVKTLEEAAAIEPGEILVTSVTDVGWTPYFSLISGLVADIGSSISHGAVVAREYGLPAVVGLGIGTKVFQTGDRIEVDGNTGIVRKINS